ncbi:hypothetical protein [Candidatus Methylopumilus turicensis]|uniref:Uncharacterized protein n=1 Tax=Candidatus Methylopumilus turicensis TaxID=1581680 RepID=A0A0B7IYR6_9PROT|nr:hypothetical protein [Candidatus Methylopumilus turicensis]CEN55566.1 conserved protein of unknown function [Candidatus Methylopumilus turicensis]
MKSVNVDYVAKAKALNEEDRDRVLSRMCGKLPKRLHKEKLTVEEAIAIQLELEDEQLEEWRANMAVIQEKAAKAKLKADEKAAKSKSKDAPFKTKDAPLKTSTETKVQPSAKPAVAAKVAVQAKAPVTPAVKK